MFDSAPPPLSGATLTLTAAAFSGAFAGIVAGLCAGWLLWY